MAQPRSSEQSSEQEPASAEIAEVAAAAPDDAAGVEQLSEQVRQLEAELEELRAQQARAVADYQNLRRRSAEERREQARLTQKALVLNYLPVLDDLNRALDSVHEHEEIAEHQWLEGVYMVQRKFLSVLEAGGVHEIEARGCAFDPELHEAVSYQAGPEGEVVGVVQNGYTIDAVVVRPAMVVVGNGEAAADDDAAADTTDQETAAEETASEADTREDAER